MDLTRAIMFAQPVKAAEDIAPGNTGDLASHTVSIDASASIYTVVATIYACDLATNMNPQRGNNEVSIGLILQANITHDVVIAIRGTEGIMEWIHDAQFLLVPCPFLAAAGNTEDGFTAMYKSLSVKLTAGSSPLVHALSTSALPFPQPVNSLTVCGHSLGGALATLLALDVAANTSFKTPTVYTYASPRTGDSSFASMYNHVVPNTFRVANRIDLVPKLPLPPLYEHVLGLFELNPIQLTIPPRVLVKPDIGCEHHLTTYLYLLSLLEGGTILPLSPECVP